MAPIDERVAKLETGMTEQARRVDDVRDALKHLEATVDRGFQGIDGRFQVLEARFQGFEGRLNGVEGRFPGIDARFQGLEGRLTAMDQKLDAHFVAIDAKMSRLVTLQVGTLLAVVAALAGMLSDFTR